jgi:hypothetical protein
VRCRTNLPPEDGELVLAEVVRWGRELLMLHTYRRAAAGREWLEQEVYRAPERAPERFRVDYDQFKVVAETITSPAPRLVSNVARVVGPLPGWDKSPPQGRPVQPAAESEACAPCAASSTSSRRGTVRA